MENNSRKRKFTRKQTPVNTVKKQLKDNTNHMRRKSKTTVTMRTDIRNDTSAEAYSNYSRLLQLFPYLHTVAIDRIFANCNRDFVRTIDNLLYIQRYVYFVQLNGYHPHTVDQNNVTENNHPTTNTDCSSFTDVHEDNDNSNGSVGVGDDDGYIPNGNIEGIREQLRTYEEQRNPAESEYNSSLDTEVNIFPLSPSCTGSLDYNFYTSTPLTAVAAEPRDVNVHDEISYLQLGN